MWTKDLIQELLRSNQEIADKLGAFENFPSRPDLGGTSSPQNPLGGSSRETSIFDRSVTVFEHTANTFALLGPQIESLRRAVEASAQAQSHATLVQPAAGGGGPPPASDPGRRPFATGPMETASRGERTQARQAADRHRQAATAPASAAAIARARAASGYTEDEMKRMEDIAALSDAGMFPTTPGTPGHDDLVKALAFREYVKRQTTGFSAAEMGMTGRATAEQIAAMKRMRERAGLGLPDIPVLPRPISDMARRMAESVDPSRRMVEGMSEAARQAEAEAARREPLERFRERARKEARRRQTDPRLHTIPKDINEQFARADQEYRRKERRDFANWKTRRAKRSIFTQPWKDFKKGFWTGARKEMGRTLWQKVTRSKLAKQAGFFAARTAGKAVRYLAANPMVAVGVAAAAAAVALSKLPNIVEGYARGQLEGQRRLQGYDYTTAAAFQRYDYRAMLRNIRVAQETGPSVARLADATANLQDATAGINSGWQQVKNVAATEAAKRIEDPARALSIASRLFGKGMSKMEEIGDNLDNGRYFGFDYGKTRRSIWSWVESKLGLEPSDTSAVNDPLYGALDSIRKAKAFGPINPNF